MWKRRTCLFVAKHAPIDLGELPKRSSVGERDHSATVVGQKPSKKAQIKVCDYETQND